MFKNPFSEEVWSTTYKDHNDKKVEDTLRRVARTMAAAEKDNLQQLWEEEFYEQLRDFKITVGGRTYSNAGTDWGGTTFINCFVGPNPTYDIDSLDGILKVLRDQAQTLKSEGGWGMNFSFIRPRGAFIHGVGVETPGSVKYMEMFDKSSEIVTSGSGRKNVNGKAKGKIRKGAMMAVLCDWHPDIVEFVTAKQTPGRLTKFNMSVGLSDEFMKRLEKIEVAKKAGLCEEIIEGLDKWLLRFPNTKDPHYKEEWNGDLNLWMSKGYEVHIYDTISVTWLWNLIMESTYNRAEPGVLFLDRANYYNPLSYLETIAATNPCFTGDTEVLTTEGYQRLDSLVGQKVTVWNGQEWSEVEPRITAENQEIIDFEFSNGSRLSCTPYHTFYLKDGSRVEAKDLVIGTKLTKFNLPVIEGESALEYAYAKGFYSGDGSRDSNEIWLYGSKCDLVDMLPVRSISDQTTGNQRRLLAILDIDKSELDKNFVPGPEYTVAHRLEWLAGIFDSDGSVLKDGSVQVTSINRDFLENIQKMLNTLGCNPTLSLNKPAQIKLMPNGKGGHAYYECKDCFRLNISGTIITRLVAFGLSTNRLNLTYEPSRESSRNIYVSKISKREGLEKYVYCFNEPKNHTAIFNGILTGQCGEQTLAPGGCCNLGSINLTQFILKDGSGFDEEGIRNAVIVLVRLLDNVNTVSKAPLPEYEYSMQHKRRIGIGAMGWGSALYMLRVRFGSEQAAKLRDQIESLIARTAYMSSIDLAIEKGMFSLCVPKLHIKGAFIQSLNLPQEYLDKLLKYGIRNSSLLSIQPTGNTGIFANIVSGGIEPLFFWEYIRTMILSTIPDEIQGKIPKFWEGEFFETEDFKLVTEGNDELLRGVGASGTVYKIDKNRGLTKEVHCEDYGVQWLKERGLWDPEADWAVTAMDLSVQDHVNDLKGFARWVDSAISKTVNVPYDCPFEEFKSIYIDSYSSGYVKGVTTYRAGTMMSVLSAKDEKNAPAEDEEIILEDVKLPDSAPALVKTLKCEGKKWYLTVIMNENNNRPFALFVTTNVHEPNVTTFDAVERLLGLAVDKGIPEKHIDEIIQKIKRDNNHTKVSRIISLLLRHGVFIRNIVSTLDSIEDVVVGSFLFQIKKFLASFVKDGEKIEGAKCPECGSELVFKEGCASCSSCSWTKCG